MRVIIEEYNTDWKLTFLKERSLLLQSIKEVRIEIEHIGSTAVEGLGAKPIIDILIGLENFDAVNNHIRSIGKLGYNYVSEYEDEMPYRRFFIKELNGVRTHHIHMVVLGTEFWVRQIKFRDFLIESETDKNAYCNLKKNLAKKDWVSRNDYSDAKSDFIKSIESKIRVSRF